MIHSLFSFLSDIGMDFVHIGIFLVGVIIFAFALGLLFSSIANLQLKGNDSQQDSNAAMFGGCAIGAIVGFILNLCLCVNFTVGQAFFITLGISLCLAILFLVIVTLTKHLQRRRARASQANSSVAD